MKIVYRGVQQTKDALSGKARVKDRRVAVQLILQRLQGGTPIETIAKEYFLSEEQVKDAIGYALKYVRFFDKEQD